MFCPILMTDIWNKIREWKVRMGWHLPHKTLMSKKSNTKKEPLPETAWCTHKTTRKTYSLTSIFSVYFKESAQSKCVFPLFEPRSWSELSTMGFQKKLQQMHYTRSCLSTVIHIHLWSLKYCGIKVFTVFDINLC